MATPTKRSPSKKSPSKKSPPSMQKKNVKTMRKEKPQRKVRGKKRSNGPSYATYVKRLCHTMGRNSKNFSLSSEGMDVVDAFINDMFERLVSEADRVTEFDNTKTLNARAVIAAVKLVLPTELSNHTLASLTAAAGRFAKSQRRK